MKDIRFLFVNKGRLSKDKLVNSIGGNGGNPCKPGGTVSYFVECATLKGTCRPLFSWCGDEHTYQFCKPQFKGSFECGEDVMMWGIPCNPFTN